ncbi:MAG: hypothetical protein KAF27_10000 [Porphyrobacter sp.]|nr:hypothetical protein [Porphyrobacter sp.]
MNLPLIDHIWRVRGAVPVDSALTPEDAFARLAPMLETPGTALSAEGGVLTYAKHNPAAQDKFATFTRGRLWIERAGSGAVLRFDLFSHALLLCFLAPLLFLGFAQLASAINAWEAAGGEGSEKAAKKDGDKPKRVEALNPVDVFLGAPAPEDPSKKKDAKDKEGRHSPDEGYYLAGFFALVYLAGRWLEPFLVRRRLRAALSAPAIR